MPIFRAYNDNEEPDFDEFDDDLIDDYIDEYIEEDDDEDEEVNTADVARTVNIEVPPLWTPPRITFDTTTFNALYMNEAPTPNAEYDEQSHLEVYRQRVAEYEEMLEQRRRQREDEERRRMAEQMPIPRIRFNWGNEQPVQYTIEGNQYEPLFPSNRSKSGRIDLEPIKLEPDMFTDLPLYEKMPFKGATHRMLTPQGVKVAMQWMHNLGMGLNYTQFSEFVAFEDVLPKHAFIYRGEEYGAGGKLVNRMDKVCQALWHRKLATEEKTDVGNLLEPHYVGGDEYYFDIVNRIDWRSGAFGEKDAKFDGGSCWWYDGGLDNPNSRVSRFSRFMEQGKALGLRLWLKNEDKYIGVGRCWVIRTRAGYPILFNSYGFNSPLVWAARLSRTLKFTNYNKITLVIHDLPPGSVNGDMGVIIGYPDNFEVKQRYDFRLDV